MKGAPQVQQLVKEKEATPKSLMRVMGIHGLTLYHLKSHLQKYRLGKSQQSQTYNDNKQEEYTENQRTDFCEDFTDGTQNHTNESLQIAQALQMQMEVQRKLHEQIEVQRHLQLRIEAQGKYLQSVLKKAQDTLAVYNSSSMGVELAKAELSQLVSMVDTGCPSSSLSVLTEIGGSSSKDTDKKHLRGYKCSLESSLTSSESSGRKEETQLNHETDKCNENSVVLSLMEMHSGEKGCSSNEACGRKRRGSIISDGNCVEQAYAKRSSEHSEKNGGQLRKSGLLGTLDLNTGPITIDLNCKGV
ncbi:unnamed protein product [Ilex paraguariensis]|uniref:MYB-CC type transcription factor LHEQLE-containing domain-containing protein n=1 Tax=Ilex paraguariensis TaxID=185542 RepID=A0ABC8R2Q2_9AQUA